MAALLGAAPLAGRLAVTLAVVVTYVGWATTSLNQRYGLFLLVLMAAGATGLLRRAMAARRAARLLVLVVVALTAAAHGVHGVMRHLRFYEAHGVAAGGGRRGVMARDDAWRAGVALDRLLPVDAVVLVIADGRLALLPRRAVLSSAYDTPAVTPLLEGTPSLAEVTRRARQAGVTHVLVNFAELARWNVLYGYGDRLPEPGLDLLRDWTRQELVPVGRWRSVDAWALPPPPG